MMTMNGWRERGVAPFRWVCALLGHTWKTDGWQRSPYTVYTHSRVCACTVCGEAVFQKDYCDARTNEQPDPALPK